MSAGVVVEDGIGSCTEADAKQSHQYHEHRLSKSFHKHFELIVSNEINVYILTAKLHKKQAQSIVAPVFLVFFCFLLHQHLLAVYNVQTLHRLLHALALEIEYSVLCLLTGCDSADANGSNVECCGVAVTVG